MLEIDFLPKWYPAIQRRKRILKVECWLLLALIAALGGVAANQQRGIQLAQQNLTNLHNKIETTTAQQKLLDEQISLRKQLQSHKSLLAAIGEPMEASHLLTTLESLMPQEMSLSEFNCELEETPRPSNAVKLGEGTNQFGHRLLKLRIVGVAPSDLDLANFLTAMTNVPFFQNVIPNYASPKTEAGHVLREFEVTCSVDLSPSAVGEVTWAK